MIIISIDFVESGVNKKDDSNNTNNNKCWKWIVFVVVVFDM